MSSQRTQDTIEQLQRGMEAYQKQIEQEIGRDNHEAVPGLQQKITEDATQIKKLQSQLADELKQEAKEEADKAREQQKKDDKGSIVKNMIGF